MKNIAKTALIILLTAVISSMSLICLSAASENRTSVSGRIYAFEEKSDYNIENAEIVDSSAISGSLTVSGRIDNTTVDNVISVYEVSDNELLAFSYDFDRSLLSAPSEEWHLIGDNKKTVNGIKLDDKIEYGAIILETSLDGEKWILTKVITNAFEDAETLSEPFYETNDIQLNNGCYYRITVAYKTEIEVDPSKILFFNKTNYEYKKYAEVYEFYAKYQNVEKQSSPSNERRFQLGTMVNAGKDKGYSETNDITADDPHYGWELGNFFISGYTEKTDDNIFLKIDKDKITLWFNLKQDIAALNSNPELFIAEDKDGYDQYFQTAKTNFGQGTLIIRYTDYEGVSHDPIIYTDYLNALASPWADTRVQLFEEGDYEVALDYKIKSTKGINKTYDYRISFTFKVRNGNCMVYPFDVTTGSELKNSSVTENGFYLDLAKSRYLKINITMARWTKGANGYTEDIRFNRPAKDGDKYTDEGIYTIEVSNPSTGETTSKKIYVGTDSVLIASMNAANAGYTINEISALVDQGAVISEDGSIIMPTASELPNETTAEPEDETEEDSGEQTEEPDAVQPDTDISDEPSVPADTDTTTVQETPKGSNFMTIIVICIIVFGVALAAVLKLKSERN